MKCTRIIAIAMAALIAFSPIAEARGSSGGHSSGGHSGFSAGHSSVSVGRSTPTIAPSATRSSGFTSAFGSGSSKSTPIVAAAPAAKATATGKAMYSANANKAAVAAYNAPKSTPAPTVAAAPAAPYHYTPPAPANYNGGGYVARSPAPVVIHNNTTYVSHDSGGMSGFWWYMLGRESAPRHDTVIVQQPGTTVIQQAPVGYAGAPGSVNGVAPAGSVAAAPGTAMPQAQSAQAAQDNGEDGHHGFLWGLLRVLLWLALIGGLIFLASKLWSAWTARKARFAHKNNYTL